MNQEKIKKLLTQILKKEFKNPNKHTIYLSGNRLNFSCPYCGDSKDPRKKRGNFYLDTLTYKCYNGGCGIFKDSISLFRDFDLYNQLTVDEISEISELINENKKKKRTIYGNVDINHFFDININDILIDRNYFVNQLKLIDVTNTRIEKYLRRRSQEIDNKFAWDPKRERLFLFNLSPNNKIIGLQIRNMNNDKKMAKYLTYKLSGIYEKLLYVTDKDILEKAKKIDSISHVFGIGSLDFSNTVTIFEGPMDSWLWKNSVGLCSLENKFPFDMDDMQYWYDWDKSGIEKTIELLYKGYTVFNWGKFLDENDLTKNRKWDLNDLVIHLRSTGKKIKRFEQYFTNDPLDIAYFIES